MFGALCLIKKPAWLCSHLKYHWVKKEVKTKGQYGWTISYLFTASAI